MNRFVILALLGISLNTIQKVSGLPLQALIAERQKLAQLALAEQ